MNSHSGNWFIDGVLEPFIRFWSFLSTPVDFAKIGGWYGFLAFIVSAIITWWWIGLALVIGLRIRRRR